LGLYNNETYLNLPKLPLPKQYLPKRYLPERYLPKQYLPKQYLPNESLFIKVKHNRGRDTRREKVWVFGLYERATEDEPKRVLFFKVESRNAITLLNIIYNHLLPETTIYSDEWAAYNRIVDLDRNFRHQTVNHSLTFVAPDGTHTNSIESTWRAAKRQFKLKLKLVYQL
jgi:IS1 family transposase